MKSFKKTVPSIAAGSAYASGLLIGILASVLMHQHLVSHPQRIAALAIIQHNAIVLGMMFLGILTFGIITLGVLFFNGAALGLVAGVYAQQGKLLPLLLALAPHGVLEIGAFLLGGYADLLIVSHIWKSLHTAKRRELRPTLLRCLVLNGVALLMLIVAGYIEHALFLTV